jgi:SAM-dependent methyltransferase
MMHKENIDKEIEEIHQRYANRNLILDKNRYSLLNPAYLMESQERERSIASILSMITPLDTKKIIEVGCGDGDKIHQLIKFGFKPENIVGNELLPNAIAKAKKSLPDAIKLLEGDATQLDIEKESFDIVYQSVVFSSILSSDLQEKLAQKMWKWVKPGGGVLWYDFIYDNPKNKDVRGVPIKRIKALFPEANITIKHITLAPPISRRVAKMHPFLYTIFNLFPFLRTHVLCFLQKPKTARAVSYR